MLSELKEGETLKKKYVRVPRRQKHKRLKTLRNLVVGSILSPAYLLLAQLYGVPGIWLRLQCALLGLRLLFRGKTEVTYSEIFRLLLWPMDSTRYFEFDFVWNSLFQSSVRYYLDVSSPRLFPIVLLIKSTGIDAELVNPDGRDLKDTAALVQACELDSRCQLREVSIEDAPFAPRSFDLITSISVVEHIPEDKAALSKMWELLRPGGRLLLSVPCAAIAEEQHLDIDHFGLQVPTDNGFFFHQYIYDQDLITERFYKVLGSPTRFAVYGEKKAGTLLRGLIKKWSGQDYPFWKEPYAMAREFRQYERISDLPGEGVIMMEFVKG